MSTLAEYLREDVQRRREEWPRREETAREWQTALNELFDHLTAWLRDADAVGVLRVKRDAIRHYEPRLGSCELPQLTVGYEASEVIFHPRLRFPVVLRVGDDSPGGTAQTADGFVSILSPNPTGYILFRLFVGGQSRWFLTTHGGPQGRKQYAEFTREEAERLLVGLLK